MPIDFDRVVAQATGELRGPLAVLPRLNLGSGEDRRPGYVDLDRVPLAGIDVAAGLGAPFLPFRDDAFGVVLCRDILEHVEIVPALREVHRVTAPGGLVIVSAVHFTSRNLFVDPTHVRGFSVRTLEFFVPTGDTSWHRSYYFDFGFRRVQYGAVQFGTTLGKGRFLVWDRLVEPVVNRGRAAQDLYEMTFLSRLFPAVNVVAILQK
ncbi:MAG: methyltransferase domain-containing protein [Acidimicrobiales bacterium]